MLFLGVLLLSLCCVGLKTAALQTSVERLWVEGKPYRAFHRGQLSLPSLRGRYIEYRPARLGLRRGAFVSVGWQVTRCDPIWQVTLRNSVMGFQSVKARLYLLRRS